ncbi:MAG: hypothetical protein H6Q20_1842 [Bacteroidetes bacterium]|jgi:hypothetical protein|nr:hypothetical protein [Bacteroidota bacterium]
MRSLLIISCFAFLLKFTYNQNSDVKWNLIFLKSF